MSLRERFGQWLLGRQGVEPIPFHPTSSNMFGTGLGHQPDTDTLLRESLGVADMATRAIANRVSTLNPQVKVTRRVMAGTTEDEILDEHPLKQLLDRPHPNLSRSQLLRLTAQYVVTAGEAYWLKIGSGLGVPASLDPIPPGKVVPLMLRNVVEGYAVTDGDGHVRDVPADAVVRFYWPDPENPWGPEGYLGPAGVTADTLKFAGQHVRHHYQHDATPPSAMETTDSAVGFTPEQRDRFETKWRQSYHNRMGTKAGIPAILPMGYKLVQLAMQSGADIVPLLDYMRDEQLMGFGVPRSVLGQVVSGDRSSAETNQFVFDQHTVLPVAMLIADSLTLQLAPDFDKALFVEFEPFVSEDKDFTLAQETADLAGKVRSINQVRIDRALDPVPWGDEPVGKVGEAPYDPAAFEFEPDLPSAFDSEDADPMPDDEVPEDERTRLHRGAFFQPRAEWERQVRREIKWIPAFTRAVRSLLREQRQSVLNRLDEQRQRAIDPNALFQPEEWVALFERRVEPLRLAAFREILAETLAGLGIDDFTFTDEMRKVVREQGAAMIQRANATTQKRIREQVEVSLVEGEGVDSLAKRIQSVFSTRRKEARTIARTEVLKASQQAQVTGFETSGVVERKRWHTSLDDAVRDTHAETEGQTVGLREPFTLGDGEAADAPGLGAGGTSLSAHNSINCRCFVVPVLEG